MENLAHKKLGKLPRRDDQRTLRLANYMRDEALPVLPDQKNWGEKVTNWGMMGNDTISDCTIASAGHLIELWTSNINREVVPPEQAIIHAYSRISGYNPETGQDDNGAVMLDALNYWRKIGIDQHKIQAYAELEPRNHDHVRATVYIFGGCYVGLALPKTAMTQTVWSVPPEGATGDAAPNSLGGHAVPIIAYSPEGLTVVTWGMLQQVTWDFWDTYCDEAYAVLSEDFVNPDQVAASGVAVQDMFSDLQKVSL